VKKKAKKVAGPDAWKRYGEGRCFYFQYPVNDRTVKLLDTGSYGIVQLICIDYAARDAFMAGFRASKRSGLSK
jgi:hypothetical protein